VEAEQSLVLRLHSLHRSAPGRGPVLDAVSRRWLATLVSAEEISTQIEDAFLSALDESNSPTASTPGSSPRCAPVPQPPPSSTAPRPTVCQC
jgi:hypothetical protein